VLSIAVIRDGDGRSVVRYYLDKVANFRDIP
jgi:hypothetical protein